MSNENEVRVQAVRSFDGDEGFKTPSSAPFAVTRQRFADLKANGLVEAAGDAGQDPDEKAADEKAAPKPVNKAAPKPENK